MPERTQTYRQMHPEDVKAAIRKKYGTIREFHRVYDLPVTGLQDILRGRSSRRIADAVDAALAPTQESNKLDSTDDASPQHQNAKSE